MGRQFDRLPQSLTRRWPFAATLVAVGVNSLSLGILCRPGAPALGSSRGRLLVHSVIILPGWLWFVAEVRALDLQGPRNDDIRSLDAVGLSLQAAGWVLVAAGFRVLGPRAIVNADLFQRSSPPRSRDGIYSLFSQPIYTGYSLIIFGRGLARRSATFAALGIWLGFLLLLVQARVEDLVFDRNRGSTAQPMTRGVVGLRDVPLPQV